MKSVELVDVTAMGESRNPTIQGRIMPEQGEQTHPIQFVQAVYLQTRSLLMALEGECRL